MKISINIIGQGNVGYHLANAFSEAAEVSAVNSRTLEGFNPEAAISIIAVSDQAIMDVAYAIKAIGYEDIVAHTSGSTSLEKLGSLFPKAGVFYPLQTFSKQKNLDYRQIPFFIEGTSEAVSDALLSLATTVADYAVIADSGKRRKLHIAAVLACNFANHLWTLASDLLEEDGLDFKALIPLLSESVEKVKTLHPALAQTGPAIRGDRNIVESHVKELIEASHPDIASIYRALSESIINRGTNIPDQDVNKSDIS